MDVKIRPAEPSDSARILEMLAAIGKLHSEGRPDIYCQNLVKYSTEELVAIMADERSPIIVAELDGEVVGYAFMQIKEVRGNSALVERRYVYVDDLCVDESSRGHGIGRLLMDGVVDYTRSIGLSKVELNVWEFNESAVRFYERYGMSTQKRQMELDL